MATLMMVVLYFFTPALIQPISESNIIPVLVAIFLLTFLIPMFSVGMLKVTKSISSLKLEKREERVMPFFFIAVYYGLATYLFAFNLRLSEVVVIMFGAIAVVIFLASMISIKFKISAHAAGAWGVAGFLTAIHFKFSDHHLLWPLVVSFVLAGAISSARLALNSHSPKEVGFGALLGFVITFGALFIFM